MLKAFADGLLCLLAVTAATSSTSLAALPGQPAPPPARPVVEDYFGTKVTDPYRYMENLHDPQVLAWIRAQGAYTAQVLGSIPGRPALLARITAFVGGFDLVGNYQRFGGRSFYLEQPAGQIAQDLVVEDPGGTKRTLVDINGLIRANGGAPSAINYFQASPDGTRVAVGVSQGGSEQAVLAVYDVASGRQVGPSFDRARGAGPQWSADGRTLFFSRLQKLPPGAPRSQELVDMSEYASDLSSAPRAIFGVQAPRAPTFPSSYIPAFQTFAASSVVAMQVQDGVHNEMDVWLAPSDAAASGDAAWTRLLSQADGVTQMDAVGDRLYLLSHKDAPTFQVLELKAGQPLSAARVILPLRPDRVVDAIHAATDGLYVTVREGVYSRLLRIPLDGGAPQEIALPFKGSISEAFSDPRRPGVVVLQENYSRPKVALEVTPGAPTRTLALGRTPPGFDPAAYDTLDLQARAKDGVEVPLTLTRRKGAARPQVVFLDAYGSYGIPQYPGFYPSVLAAMDVGGAAIAECHVRGGGEGGEAWRLAGKDANKPNTWRDLIACAEALIAQGYTTPKLLETHGGSAGGITMGMAMTERPDLFGSVTDMVPMASTLRHEFQVNGPANIPEFGTVKDPAGFRNLLAMDGYQHVRDGVRYPPVLITTGLNDPRVDSWQPAKLAARLLASGDPNPVLLRVDEAGGHGIGSTEAQFDALIADTFAFSYWQAGLPGWAPSGLALKPH